jgi:hypothetical protein
MKPPITDHPDIVVFDAGGTARAVVDVNAHRSADERAKQDLVARLPAWEGTEFILLADRQHIQIYRRADAHRSEPLLTLNTAEVLTHYDPDFASKEVFERYFTVLLEAWLRDVAYHWKSEKPPAFDAISAIGLAQCIHDGRTQAAFMLDASDR